MSLTDDVIDQRYAYNPFLGLYQHFIHGDPTQSIDRMICMTVFHLFIENHFVQHTVYYKYIQYLIESISMIVLHHPDWTIRLYIDDSITSRQNAEHPQWEHVLAILKQYPIQIVWIKVPLYYLTNHHCHKGLLPTLFRYLVLFDPHVDVCVFHDIDNIWTEQDFYMLNHWINHTTDDGILYLDEFYRKQEVTELTDYDAVRAGKDYLSIFAGVWGFRIHHRPLSYHHWHKMLFYIEESMAFVYQPRFKSSKFYQNPFIYGFEELALSRVLLPLLMGRGHTFHIIPIKIWNIELFKQLFDQRLCVLHHMIGLTPPILQQVRAIILNEYWDMTSSVSGRAQFFLAIITHIYFRIITRQAPRFQYLELEPLLTELYPFPFLMSIGLFIFKNILKYPWYPHPVCPRPSGSMYVEHVCTQHYYKIPWIHYLE